MIQIFYIRYKFAGTWGFMGPYATQEEAETSYAWTGRADYDEVTIISIQATEVISE